MHKDRLVSRFYGMLEAEFATGVPLSSEFQVDIVHLAEDIVVEIAAHAGIVRFWHNPHAQDALRRQLIHTLDDRDDLFPFHGQAAVADRLMELAKANRSLIAARTHKAEDS